MPNWCENILKFSSYDQKLLYKIKEELCSEDEISELTIDFNKIIPEPKTKEECPKEFIIGDSKEGHLCSPSSAKPWFDWYHWRLVFWGTKWTPGSTVLGKIQEINRSGVPNYEMTWSFSTAWSPAIPVILAIINKYCKPGLCSIRSLFYEPGQGFAGEIDGFNGIKNYSQGSSVEESAKYVKFLFDNRLIDEEEFHSYVIALDKELRKAKKEEKD